MKTFLTIIITAAVLGAGYWAWGRFVRGGGATAQAAPTAVRVEPVVRGELVETVSAPGTVQPKTKVSISAKVAARIVELPFKEGDAVTRGDPSASPPKEASLLVRLDAKDLEAALRSAQARYAAQEAQIEVSRARAAAQKAQIEASQVTLKDAQRDLRRQLQLFESKDVSQSVVDTAQSKVDELQAQLVAARHNLVAEETNLTVMQHTMEAADAEVAKARDDLSYTRISAPIDGVVTRLNAEVGELVMTGTMNNAGTVILEVADLDRMLFVARVDEASIAQIEKGQRARVHVPAFADREFEGTVTSVALANTDDKDQTRYFKVEILLNTEGRRLFSGLNADADIQTKRHADAIMVPSQAVLGRQVEDLPEDLRQRPEVDKAKSLATVVYRFVDGKAVVTPVKVGPSDATRTIIVAGLSEVDRVIIGPYKVLDGLRHDQRVTDNRAGGAATKPATKPATTQVTATNP